jgi:hypothetical protein
MRIFGKIILAMLGLFLAVILAAIVLGRVFEDELTAYAVGGLNRYIRTEVKVGDVKLSFLKNFPDATLDFRDVYMASVPGFQNDGFNGQNTDTLLVARHLFLRFNVLKFLRQQYLVREVRVQSGQLNLFIDPAGKGNYSFWVRKEAEDDKDFFLELDNVKMDDIRVSYDNRALQIEVSGMVRKSYFRGLFSTVNFSMSAGLEGTLHRYSNKGTLLLSSQSISTSAELNVDPRTIRIEQASLKLAGQELLVEGSILRPKPLEFDLNLEGKHLDLENLLRHFALSDGGLPGDLHAGGDLDFRGSVKGIVSNTKMPQIKADFSLQNGWLQSSRLPKEVKEIKLVGNYSNGNRKSPGTTLIELKGVSIRFGNSRLGGDYSVYNLIRPDFNYKIKADLDLTDIQDFMVVDSIFENMEGRLLAEVSMQGDRALLRTVGKKDLLNYDYQANFRLDDVSLTFRGLPFRFSKFTGDAVFTDHLVIKNLSGIFGESQVSLSGRVDNFLEYLFTSGANLWMDIDLYSERVDLNQPGLMKADEAGSQQSDTVLLPEKLYLKARFWFDELQARDFRATQVTGDLIYRPRRLSINHLEGLSMSGQIETEGILEQQNDDHFLVKSSSKISSVDITEAFQTFHNFGQDFIVDRHIKGSLSGTVNFSAGLTQQMRIQKETVLTDCNVIIRNGELTGFEPMMKLSRFIEVEELSNVKFSTLTNEIFIRNQEIVIPNMDIHSSAFDITASGLHGFDGNYTYKVKVSLSELLARKSRKPSVQDSEFGVVEDDGLGKVYIYLIIEGTPETTEVRYDRRGAVQNIREQMQVEKKELKQILNEEFGLFKKDTTLGGKINDKEPGGFIIRWEEDSVVKQDMKMDNISEKERFIIEWDDDVGMKADTVPVPQKKTRKRK